jgi:hypothetical protein
MNIEEIKKEIKNTFYIDENNMHFEVAKINIDTLFKILDKYKDKEDKYKKMWEELYSENEKPCGIEYMQDLEDKYKIEVE